MEDNSGECLIVQYSVFCGKSEPTPSIPEPDVTEKNIFIN